MNLSSNPTSPLARPAAIPALALALALALAGCANVITDAEKLSAAGQPDVAASMLADARLKNPADLQLRAAWLRQRELALVGLAGQSETARVNGRFDEARAALARMEVLDAQNPRTVLARNELERQIRRQDLMASAETALREQRDDDAEARLRELLAEAPGHPGARAAMLKLRERRSQPEPPRTLGATFQRPVTIEFRDAPLRTVLEGLAATHGVNFVFDRDVRSDTKVSIMLKDVSLDDALRVLLTTQQLERKVLNESTLLIYPATQAKQREHQDLVSRTFYLTNADVKQAQAMVRTLARTRDMFVDERLNMIVVRDTPEVVHLVERLIASLDLPDPEVLLEVEVLEVTSNTLEESGLKWPESISYGLPDPATIITRATRGDLRASIANPAIVATLHETRSQGNVIANPRLRARNHEKAKILIGEKLPVFASAAATATVSGTTTVSYIDVGLKLDVEPSVQLDNDVIMKVNLEVSSLIAKVAGPSGSVGYQVGTRQATTSLRLRDGETQVLAGLIQDNDSRGVDGVPVLADLPVAGRLFGLHSNQRVKTEVVLLITPRVVRNIGLPETDVSTLPSGIDASPGAEPLRLRTQSKVAVPMQGGPARATAGTQAAPALGGDSAPVPAAPSALMLSTSGQVDAGGTAAVTLQNRTPNTVAGELEFDTHLLKPAAGNLRNLSRLPFTLPPGGERVFLLRVQDAAAGGAAEVSVSGVSATLPDGASGNVDVQGSGTLQVNPKAAR